MKSFLRIYSRIFIIPCSLNILLIFILQYKLYPSEYLEGDDKSDNDKLKIHNLQENLVLIS